MPVSIKFKLLNFNPLYCQCVGVYTTVCLVDERHLEYGGTIGCSPGVEQIVFACGDKPLPCVGKLEGQHTGVVKVELILLWTINVQHLHMTALHSELVLVC